MPDIVELQIVLLGPEERHRVEALARPEYVAGSRLALPFGDDPVLDADRLACQPVGPSGDIAGGPDTGDARLEIRVDSDAALDPAPYSIMMAGRYQTKPPLPFSPTITPLCFVS